MSGIDPNPGAAGSLRRLRGLVRKETLQILRDPSSISIAFVLPVCLLLLFGYGVSLDARHVPVGVVNDSRSGEAAGFVESLSNSTYFAMRPMRDLREAQEAMTAGSIDAVIVLRADFARRLASPSGAPIQVNVDGVDANTGRLVSGYVQGAWRAWLVQFALDHGQELSAPVRVEPRVWFNAEVRSRNFLVPGLIAIVMTLIGTLLTAMVVAREWERGSWEALMVTPVRIGEVVLGKLIPYFTLGMGGMALSTAMGVWVFDVPLRGSSLALLGMSALYMLAALGLGLMISTAARSQFVAGQVAIVVAFLPAFILSGFIFDIASMPTAVQWLTHVLPARYFVSSLQTLFLAGDVRPILIVDGGALALMAAILLALTLRRMRKSLE